MDLTRDEITISCEFEEDDTLPIDSIFEVIKDTARGEERKIAGLSVILGDDDLLRRLNRQWLRIDEPTDVLSFDLTDELQVETTANHESRVTNHKSRKSAIDGEIYVSLDRVRAQAVEHGDKPERELLRLVVHGMLHLCGIDHDDDVSLREMIERGENYVQKVYKRYIIGR
ncbi:rRNA maturation RNase YbeY [bacterium]|nr:rRNA maturation RNase YbeY [bacterium]